jgi:heptosyltransferase-3
VQNQSSVSKLNPKRVLFIATRQIGDVLITTPLIERAKELWPNAQFDFLGYKNKLSIIQGNPHIETWIETSERPSLVEYLKLFIKLFRRYDLALITQPSDRSYLYGILASKKRVGVIVDDTKNAQKKSIWKQRCCIYTVSVDYFFQHVIVEKLRLLEPFFANPEEIFNQPIRVSPPVPEKIPQSIDEAIQGVSLIVLHPGPLNAYKRWPLAYWAELMEWLVKQGFTILLSASPAKQDIELNQAILSLLKMETRQQVINAAGSLSFSQLTSVLLKSKLYIGVDTSATHLAAACEIPTIALFGATPPTNYGPWPNGFIGKEPYQIRARSQTVKNVTILQGPGDCVPCRKAGCEDKADSRSECLDLLTPQQVIDSIQKRFNINGA